MSDVALTADDPAATETAGTEAATEHRRGGGDHTFLTALLAVAVAAAGILGLAATMGRTSYDIWGAFFIGPVLVLLTVPIAVRIARIENDGRVALLILVALLAKFAGSVARYVVAFDVYGGQADATQYHLRALELAPLFRAGEFSDLGHISGTRFLEILTGGVYAVIGTTRMGGFLVFAWMAFLGALLFYRAFRIAWPDGDHKRYRLLLFFLPTMLYWPSSIGKEAWMLLCLGTCAYGLARIVARRRGGFVLFALGVWGNTLARPHLALMVLGAALVALVLQAVSRRAAGGDRRGTRMLVAGLVVVLSVLVISQAERFFNVNAASGEDTQALLADVVRRTETGGSAFTASNPLTPNGYLVGLFTVLFRPLPIEVSGGNAMLTAAEASLIALITLLSIRRLARVPALMLRVPYVAFALAFCAAFVFGFSTVGNFGILARQRSQLLPFFFVLLVGRRKDAPPEVTASAATPPSVLAPARPSRG